MQLVKNDKVKVIVRFLFGTCSNNKFFTVREFKNVFQKILFFLIKKLYICY